MGEEDCRETERRCACILAARTCRQLPGCTARSLHAPRAPHLNSMVHLPPQNSRKLSMRPFVVSAPNSGTVSPCGRADFVQSRFADAAGGTAAAVAWEATGDLLGAGAICRRACSTRSKPASWLAANSSRCSRGTAWLLVCLIQSETTSADPKETETLGTGLMYCGRASSSLRFHPSFSAWRPQGLCTVAFFSGAAGAEITD